MMKTPLGNTVWIVTLNIDYQGGRPVVFENKPDVEDIKTLNGASSFSDKEIRIALQRGFITTAVGGLSIYECDVIA